MSLREATIRLAHERPELRPALVPLIVEAGLSKAAYDGPKTGPMTLYYTGPAGNIMKREVRFLTEVEHNGVGGMVKFVPKRGRAVKVLMTYYTPFIMGVRGHGHPEPDSMIDPDSWEHGDGVSTGRGRYRSHDPRWEGDFMKAIGKRLQPLLLIKDGKLVKNNTGLPTVNGSNR